MEKTIISMKNKITQNIIFLLCASIFLLGNLNVFNMIFAYLGIGKERTILSVILWIIIDVTLGLYLIYKLKEHYNKKAIIAIIILNLFYGGIYIYVKDYLPFIKYVIFIIPVSIVTYLIIFEKNGIEKFFNVIHILSYIILVLAILYIIVMFVGKPNESGVVTIKEMTYGDIAYTFLPFFILNSWNFIRKKNLIDLICSVVYAVAIIYTGLRSGLLCMIFFIIISFILAIWTKAFSKAEYFRLIIVFCLVLVSVFICRTIIPQGSRLKIINNNFDMEISKHEDVKKHNVFYNVDTGKEEAIDDIYIHYIVLFDYDRYKTENMLYDDIIKGTGKFIKVNNEGMDFAKNYHLNHMNRYVLWLTSFKEFMKSPIIGNGILYYQTKYVDNFPHNVALEIMSDFGITGLIIFLGAMSYMLVKILNHMRKNKHYNELLLLVFVLTYIPKHLLYSSLYSNKMLFFIVLIFVCINIKYLEKKDVQYKR